MTPEEIKKLQENVPELRSLVRFLAIEANKLNTLDGLEGLEITERAYEVTARLRAYNKLKDILAPLVTVQEVIHTLNKREYTVDVV